MAFNLALLGLYLFSGLCGLQSRVQARVVVDLSESGSQSQTPSWPYTPFHTNGTLIQDVQNKTVNLAGINWMGHGVTMIPEGLQYQSIANITSRIKELGMNVVRLTYATSMVDAIYANDMKDVDLKTTLTNSLGTDNGTRIYNSIVKNNPDLGKDGTTRLTVFDAVAAELAKQQIYLHLDNHISQAGWCCAPFDGNGWFGDTYFNVTNWIRGLKYMTNHATSNWTSYISTSLRNEPHDVWNNDAIHATYNWTTWYANMVPAMNAIFETSTQPLIFISGMDWDRTLNPVVNRQPLGNDYTFDLTKLNSTLASKIVWELHNYNNTIDTCDALTAQIDDGGYSLYNSSTDASKVNVAPIVLSEFGFPMNSDGENSTYAQCLKKKLTSIKGGWMYWVVVGSYYERMGTQDYDEDWGILNHDWSAWRDPDVVNTYFKDLVNTTLTP